MQTGRGKDEPCRSSDLPALSLAFQILKQEYISGRQSTYRVTSLGPNCMPVRHLNPQRLGRTFSRIFWHQKVLSTSLGPCSCEFFKRRIPYITPPKPCTQNTNAPSMLRLTPRRRGEPMVCLAWVADKELKLSYHRV